MADFRDGGSSRIGLKSNLKQNIRDTSFFLVLQKVSRKTKTAVKRLLGR